jgi:hypothetical protein
METRTTSSLHTTPSPKTSRRCVLSERQQLVMGKVDQIVMAGLGCPIDAERTVFGRIAPIDGAQSILRAGLDAETSARGMLPMFQSRPNLLQKDLDFYGHYFPNMSRVEPDKFFWDNGHKYVLNPATNSKING